MDKIKLIEHFEELLTENRKNLFRKVLSKRTKYITVALENIFQTQNASAVLRTCDCYGIQDVHIIENSNKYTLNPDVTLGSNKWLSLHHYSDKEFNSLDAIKHLKKSGYRIIATTPHTQDVELPDFDLLKGPVALFFGTELTGLSDQVIENADEYVKIPMYGFTESFNISVSAAIMLHQLTQTLRNSSINWQLPDNLRTDIHITWLKNSLKNADLIEKAFYMKS